MTPIVFVVFNLYWWSGHPDEPNNMSLNVIQYPLTDINAQINQFSWLLTPVFFSIVSDVDNLP